MVPEVGLEPTSLAANDFESFVYAIPPLWRVCARTIPERIVTVYGNFRQKSIMWYYFPYHRYYMNENIPSQFQSNAVFWIDLDKIKPNPFQPRKEFDEVKLRDLAESIRMYGILQPLVVTRKEIFEEDKGLVVEYELISGERRLRASKLAGLSQAPALIRATQDDDRVKLELAIIENLQREDLNAVDRARAFQRLVEDFKFKHSQIAEKMGKSREYVTNSLRLLSLPVDILDAVSQGRISEGHARPLMMLNDRPAEQGTLFKEIIFKKLTVREAEAIARRIAYDKVRKKDRAFDPEMVELEEKLTESLGTRVKIERKDNGGKVTIDFFSNDDLRSILDVMNSNKPKNPQELMNRHIAKIEADAAKPTEPIIEEPSAPIDDRSKEEIENDNNDDELYSVKNFSL